MTITVTQAYTNLCGGLGTVNGSTGQRIDRTRLITATTNIGGYGGNPQDTINGGGGFNMASGATAGQYLQWQFLGKKRIVTAVQFQKSASAGGGAIWDLFGSQDGSTWSSSLGNITFTTATTETLNASGNTTAYSYYKIAPRTNATGFTINFASFESSGNQYEFGNRNSGSLVTCTASFTAAGGGITAATDGDLAANSTHSWWNGSSASGAWMQFDFADPVILTSIVSFDTGGSGDNGTWKVQQWDGSAWNDVSTAKLWDFTVLRGRVFDTTASVASTRYRMLGTAGTMNSGPFYQEFGFEITDSSVTPSVNADVASLALEVASTGDGSNANVASIALEVANSGPSVRHANIASFALEVLMSVAAAPTRAIDGGKIFGIDFAFQPEVIYNESDWDSIYSIGDRHGNGLWALSQAGWSGHFGDVNNLMNDNYGFAAGDGFSVNGQTGWPNGAYYSFKTADGSFQYVSGLRWISGSSIPNTGPLWEFWAGYSGNPWTRDTLEFEQFNISITTAGAVGGNVMTLQFTPTFLPWDTFFVFVAPDEVDDFPGGNFGSEMELKIYHSVLDGGDRRPTNGRTIKRVAITSSANLVIRSNGSDPVGNLIDGQYVHSNYAGNKTTYTTFEKPTGATGTRTVAVGEYLQFGFNRKVMMREMLWQVRDLEVLDSGGNPTIWGKWQWQASNSSATGFVDIGSPVQFKDNSNWMILPKPIDETAVDYNAYLYAYWRLVLVDGPAAGDGYPLYQVMFNLIDPDNQSALLEVAFSDDVDNILPTVTIGAPGNPYTVKFSDSSEDIMTATPTIKVNLSLSAAFTDASEDAMSAWGSFYPTTISQTSVVVKGR